MSNFGVTYLLKKQKGYNRLSIEDNIGEELHIHFGNMRLMLKNQEFREFASHALEYISDATDIPIDTLSKLEPIFLFDLCRRGELPSLVLHQEEYVPVGSLLCPVCNKYGVWTFKPIEKSHFLKIIENKTQSTPFDEEQVNYIGKDNVSRCSDIVEECRQNKDICEQYPLFVTSKNIIRDGQHRAAALYYLYGPDFKVKVQRMDTDKSEALSSKPPFFHSLLDFSSKKILSFMFGAKSFLFNFGRSQKRLESEKKRESENYKNSVKRPVNQSAFEKLKNDAKLRDMVYFVDPDFALSGFPVLIRKFNSDISGIKAVLVKYGLSVKKGHCMEGVTFIYGLGEDRLIVDPDGNPVAFLQNKLSSYAMSVKSFMPYAPAVQKYLNSFEDIPETILYTLRLLKCMFDKKQKGFFETDVDYFEKHKYLLNDEFFSKDGLFEEVFFGYSDRMLQILHEGDYDIIIDDYRRFEY